MEGDDMSMISAEEFFAKIDSYGPKCRMPSAKVSPEDSRQRFEEMKIRVAMKARGISREKAGQIVRALDKGEMRDPRDMQPFEGIL